MYVEMMNEEFSPREESPYDEYEGNGHSTGSTGPNDLAGLGVTHRVID